MITDAYMEIVNIHQAKTQLSKLIERVEAGGEGVIARYGKPVAKLSAVDTELPPRRPGALKGKIWIADNIDAFDEELDALYYGGTE
jgi:prevent-host-death family protein